MLHKTWLLFVLKVTAIFYCLFFLKPLEHGYVAAFRTLGGAVFGEIGEQGRVKFMPWEGEESSRMDTRIRIRDLGTRNAAGHVSTLKFEISLAYLGFVPTIFLASLIFSSPVPWPVRIKALICGLLLLQGVILLNVWAAIYVTILTNPQIGLLTCRSWEATALTTIWQLTIYGKITLAVSVLIWIAVMLRKNRLQVFLLRTGKKPGESKTGRVTHASVWVLWGVIKSGGQTGEASHFSVCRARHVMALHLALCRWEHVPFKSVANPFTTGMK